MKAYFSTNIFDSLLCPAESIKNLDVCFDSDFSLSKHVQNVYKSWFLQLHDFTHVRQFLTHDASVPVANALVGSQLDYCNSGVSLSLIFVNYSVSKIVQLESYQILVDTLL